MAEDRSRSLKMSPMEPGPIATGADPAKPPVHMPVSSRVRTLLHVVYSLRNLRAMSDPAVGAYAHARFKAREMTAVMW